MPAIHIIHSDEVYLTARARVPAMHIIHSDEVYLTARARVPCWHLSRRHISLRRCGVSLSHVPTNHSTPSICGVHKRHHVSCLPLYNQYNMILLLHCSIHPSLMFPPIRICHIGCQVPHTHDGPRRCPQRRGRTRRPPESARRKRLYDTVPLFHDTLVPAYFTRSSEPATGTLQQSSTRDGCAR